MLTANARARSFPQIVGPRGGDDLWPTGALAFVISPDGVSVKKFHKCLKELHRCWGNKFT